jgi:peptide/nickel transport system permease protein
LTRTIATRIAHALISILGLTVIVFLVVRITGDPSNFLLPDTATPEDFARLRARLGLDQSIFVQYGIFLGQLLSGDLGQSIRLASPVADLIALRLPPTLELAGAALLITIVVGLPLGVYSAYGRGGALDRVARAFAAVGQASPAFWVGLILILIVSLNLRLLPAGGYGKLENIILPAITLAIAPVAGLTRLLRSSMIEVLSTDYVKFLRIKGVPEREILWKHGLRNAGLTALTFVGVLTARLVTGAVVTEQVFTWPGMGSLLATSVEGRDFTVIQAVVLIFSIVYVAVNLLVDLLYIVLNPRLR